MVSFGGISEQAVKVFFAKVSHYTVRHLVRLVCSLMVKSTGLQNGRSKFPVPLWSDVEVCSPDIFYSVPLSLSLTSLVLGLFQQGYPERCSTGEKKRKSEGEEWEGEREGGKKGEREGGGKKGERKGGREGVLKLNPLASEATMLTCSYRASS